MICISSLDTHSVYAHTEHTMCLYWANIEEGGPALKQHLKFGGRRVCCPHYICLYSLICKEQRTLIAVIDGQWSVTSNLTT